ncbi:hypothetical protein [Paraburkholderia solisilvae]|uniref:Uncharacterized protein n=1 Tax=Paraburkholderia solisilvae TaxID=624376 RepID=A0A6J5EPJ7_9BURK|nr:hypothetical protein [Paraburkholderia solisilvae]CAB3768083.1 hypothetical protein LMG29739_05229 [Paraburkholderia solisilvae]
MTAHLFQILPSGEAPHSADAAFSSLGHADGARPVLQDFAAIKQFFATHPLEESDLYGFFPADFQHKTGLTGDAVKAFIRDNAGHDAYTFSSRVPLETCYLNVFDQAEQTLPGFIDAASVWLKSLPLDLDLGTLPMDARSTVYGHHIVAKPSFWQTWFAIADQLSQQIEDENAPLRKQLDALRTAGGEADAKRMLFERIASLVLELCPDVDVCACAAPLTQQISATESTYHHQLSLLRECKAGYGKTLDRQYLNNFLQLRNAVLNDSTGTLPARAAAANAATAAASLAATHAPASVAGAPAISTETAAAALTPAGDLLYVCFTHVPLQFEFPSFVSTLYMGAAQGPGKVNLRDLAPEWEPHHPILGAVAGSFALKNYIVKHELELRHVGICQYRKFVSNRRFSHTPASNYPVMDTVAREAIDVQMLTDLMAPGDRDFVLGRLGVVEGGYFTQYKNAHVAEDFLRFTAAAVELGVLSRDDVMPFFAQSAFMPGGIEAGVFPAGYWVQTIGAIERVVRACIAQFPLRRYGYQSRAWAFCAERLGSFLLLRHLIATYGLDWEKRTSGYLNLVTETEQAIYQPGR